MLTFVPYTRQVVFVKLVHTETGTVLGWTECTLSCGEVEFE